MNAALGYLVSALLAIIFTALPGALFVNGSKALSGLAKVIAAIFISLGFWVCVPWFLSWVSLPLSYSLGLLQLGFIVWFIAKRPGSSANPVKWPPGQWALVVAIALLMFPVFFISIPPGCDTAMHGYITRLIVNNNGLPHNYHPILPVGYFGSYSAGYHMLTAIFAAFHPELLKPAINLTSLMVYPAALLGMVFLLGAFFTERVAIATSILFFALCGTLQSTIGWGGNPSMLSFAFCLFSGGLLLHALNAKDVGLLYLSSLTIAPILLVHAIPAITFGYLLVPAVAILLWQNKAHLRWVMANGVVLLVLTFLLLLPFLIHFKNDNSPQLLAMIRDWQNGQMDKKLSGNLLRNLSVVFDKNVFFLGDILPAVTAASVALLLVFRQWRPVLLVSLFVLYIFVLMLNSAYWLLPVSELLYPERVAYFMIVACSFSLGYLLTVLGQKGYGITVMKKKATAFGFVAVVLVLLGLVKLYNGSVQLINNKTLNCNAQTMQAMDWISSHTEKDALIVVNYADAGMWVPTFTNRATLGTHIHFIHEVKHINDTLEASTAPRYIFITQNDRREHKWILGKIGNRAKVFGNSEVEVYH